MYKYRHICNVLSFAALAAGFVLSFWPLSLFGLLLAAAVGQYASAIIIGLLMDITYGAPVGRLHALYVPFTLLAFGISALRYYLQSYFRAGDRGIL